MVARTKKQSAISNQLSTDSKELLLQGKQQIPRLRLVMTTF